MRRYIVFVGRDHYTSLGVVRTLGECGIRPIIIISKEFHEPKMTPLSRYVSKCHYVNYIHEGIDLLLTKYSDHEEEKDFLLVGGDDRVLGVLSDYYFWLEPYFIMYNLNNVEGLKKYLDKELQANVAESVGFKVPKTWIVNPNNREIPEDIIYPVITKAVSTAGKNWKNVEHVCNSDRELLEKYLSMDCTELLVQQYIDKVQELSYDGFSVDNGNDVSVFATNIQHYMLPGRYSPYWRSDTPDLTDPLHSKMVHLVKKFIGAIGLNGIFELETLVDKNGDIYYMETNLRPSVIFWAYTVSGIPVVKLWCDAMLSGYIDHESIHIMHNVSSMSECYDYDVRVKGGMISKKEWKKQCKESIRLYRGRNDILPYLSFMFNKIVRKKV